MFKTCGVRYLGSKNKINIHILNLIKELPIQVNSIIDVFTGTTRVAQDLRYNGYNVITSDLSWASECYSNAFICSKENTHLQKYLDELNILTGYPGWITKNYCDVISFGNVVRVWKKHNGEKADAIRDKIETYTHLNKWEKDTLITSLILALDKVDNTIGIQQAYLKEWKSNRSNNNINLKLPDFIDGPIGMHISGDALKIQYPEADVAYLDPPYTSADYSTYYHIWDSIVKWDKPKVGLKTNRREDRIKSGENRDKTMISPWYSVNTAMKATLELINNLTVKYIICSYSNDGLIKIDEMKKIPGLIDIKQIDHKRNIMKMIGCGANSDVSMKNIEYMFLYKK